MKTIIPEDSTKLVMDHDQEDASGYDATALGGVALCRQRPERVGGKDATGI